MCGALLCGGVSVVTCGCILGINEGVCGGCGEGYWNVCVEGAVGIWELEGEVLDVVRGL